LLLVILLILIRCLIDLRKTHQEIKKLDLEKLKKDTKNKLNEFLKEMKEEIRMLDENPNFNESERNIYRRFKEIIEKAEKEIEDEIEKCE
jgi:gas vesicle protein